MLSDLKVPTSTSIPVYVEVMRPPDPAARYHKLLVPNMEAALVGAIGALIAAVIALISNRGVAIWSARSRIHEMRYTRIYEKRLEVMATIYSHLTDVEADCKTIIGKGRVYQRGASPDPISTARSTLLKASTYFEQHRLFVESELTSLIEMALIAGNQALMGADMSGREGEPLGQDPQWRQITESFISDHLPNARRAMETRFQKALGIDGRSQGVFSAGRPPAKWLRSLIKQESARS